MHDGVSTHRRSSPSCSLTYCLAETGGRRCASARRPLSVSKDDVQMRTRADGRRYLVSSGVAGAGFEISIDGESRPNWSRLIVPAGGLLEIGTIQGGGSRLYLAIRGGFPGVPHFMGSKSTYIGGALGGYQVSVRVAGRLLRLSCSRTMST